MWLKHVTLGKELFNVRCGLCALSSCARGLVRCCDCRRGEERSTKRVTLLIKRVKYEASPLGARRPPRCGEHPGLSLSDFRVRTTRVTSSVALRKSM